MSKYKIADFITEYNPLYDSLRELSKPFLYTGTQEPLFKINISDEYIKNNILKMDKSTTLGEAENFFVANHYNHMIIKHNAMLIHSSAVKYKGKAYLFSANSGVGKSTHTQLWLKAFGENNVKIINDDKPVVRIYDDSCIAYGTPFDGGSGIAINDSAPLAAVVFIERGEKNTIRKASQKEIINNLYFSTIKYVSRTVAETMLLNFSNVMNFADFYILSCNTDISAAYVARDAIVK